MKLCILGLVLAVSVQTASIGQDGHRGVCKHRTQRKAWHTLTKNEKLAYINAEKCLMKKPAKLGLAGPRTLFDELQLFHVYQTREIHNVGAFLPYHRFFMHAHEYLLKTECGYTGGQPYWDEALDAGNFTTSIVLDAKTGFGGNGEGPSNCIRDGPFKDYVNAIGPGITTTDHCIERSFNECISQLGNQSLVDKCMQMQDFSKFWPCIEDSPHKAGHGGIGGEMLNVFSSPGDPIFYLHHTYLDKLWWDWQTKSISARLKDITGTNVGIYPPDFDGTVSLPPIPENGSCSAFFPSGTVLRRDGDPANVTTLAHVLTVYGAVPNATIADVMDIQGGTLCYKYI